MRPDESNFDSLLAKMTSLHDSIASQVTEGVPRIPQPQRFSYNEINHDIPQQGRTSKETFHKLAEAFQGSIRWHQPNTLVNITPNPLLDSVAAVSLATLYNGNTLWDYLTGGITVLEKNVVAFLGHLADWQTTKPDGVSTSGGKATLMYAIRAGLNVCDRASVENGLMADYVVLASATAHYSIEDCCNYLGIGRSNLIRVPVDKNGVMLTDEFEKILRNCIGQGKKIAAIIAGGGDTLEHAVDPIATICRIRDKVTKEMGLAYRPFVHVDSVNGWIGLVFREYDFMQNPLDIDVVSLHSIQTLADRIRQLKLADSFSADFHKTGLAPYTSSFFVIRDGRQLRSLNRDTLEPHTPQLYGELHTHHFSFENSRSSQGIIGAWTSIQRLGIDGYRRYWAQLNTISNCIRHLIRDEYSEHLRLLNTSALGHPSVIQCIPPGFSAAFETLEPGSPAFVQYRDYCFELYDYMAYGLAKNNTPYPLLGFIPGYKYEISGIQRPAFLIYLNHTYFTEQDCRDLLDRIIAMKQDFEHRHPTGRAVRFTHLPK